MCEVFWGQDGRGGDRSRSDGDSGPRRRATSSQTQQRTTSQTTTGQRDAMMEGGILSKLS